MADTSTYALAASLAGLAFTVGGGIFVFGRTTGSQGEKLANVEGRVDVAHERIDRTNDRLETASKEGQATAKEVAGLSAKVDAINDAACETRDLVRSLVQNQIGRGGK